MKGQWIWTGEHDSRPDNTYTWFRRVVDLTEAPATAEMLFAADTAAQLWVNGYLLKRKVTRFHEPDLRADVVPVARHLRPGKNVIVVLHHSWGDIVTFQRSMNYHAGLYVDASWVVSDDRWRWKRAEEFSRHTDQFAGADGGTKRIRYPVRWKASSATDPAAYHAPDFDDASWDSAVPVSDGPWPQNPMPVETPPQRESPHMPLAILAAGRVVPGVGRKSPMAAVSVRPEGRATSAATALVHGTPYPIEGSPGEVHYVTVDMLRPVHGYPRLDLENDADVELAIGYGELATSPHDGRDLVTEDGWIDVDGVVAHGYADTLEPAAGGRSYEFPDERTARWITVHVRFRSAGTLTIRRLELVKSQYPIELRGSFQCGDERIDQIVKLGLIHAEVTMSDAYVDTPGREDGQWIEDARPRATLASRWFGDNRLRRLMIRSIAEGQHGDGSFHPFFPSNYPYGASQWDWSLQWIGMVADDYSWTADQAFLATVFPTIERLWAAILETIGPDGVWRSPHVFGDIRNGPLLTEGDSSGTVTPWVIDRLRDSALLADVLGRAETAEDWASLSARMTKVFRATHLTSDNSFGVPLVADSVSASQAPSRFSQASQIIPLYDGLLDPDEAANIIETAFPAPDGSPPPPLARWNNPTWSYRILRGLSVNGYDERAVRHLLERFGPYLPRHPDNPVDLVLQGPYGGPLPEYWISRQDMGLTGSEINDRQPSDATGSHGWGAVPLLWLHEHLLGVTITEAGGARLAVRPRAAGLPFVTGTTMTPRGSVYVHFDPQHPQLTVELPAGVTALLTFPPEFAGTRIVETNARVPVADADEVLALSEGRWQFESVGPAWGARHPRGSEG